MVRTGEVTVTGNPEPAVRLTRLTKSFGPRRGIRGVDLEVNPHQVFGFLGPNGAGKSTTIRLMLGLYHPTSGTRQVLGLDPVRDHAELMRRVGYLPGELTLFGRLTGQEVLDRFAHARGTTDLSTRRDLAQRFGAELDRPVRTLSKGNRQKIGLLLAFQHRPELLVLDEPTSGLDPLLQDEFARLLEEVVAAGSTVFLSSHDLAEVQRVVDQLAIIREGQIVAADSVEGLRARAPRVIELLFRARPNPATYAALPGTELRATDSRRLVLAVTGPVTPVLAAAAKDGAEDIVARPADLDELFLTFYADKEPSHDA
jgi:ABC-2 type transport system ATP-binding protein